MPPSMLIQSPSRTSIGGFLLHRKKTVFHIDVQHFGPADRRRPELTGHHGRMTGRPAVAGENAFGGDHAVDIVRLGFRADHDHRLPFLAPFLGGIGIKDGQAHGGARAGIDGLFDQPAVPRPRAWFLAAALNCGWSSMSTCSGLTRMMAFFLSIRPSSTISTAILMAARAVRLPSRVCSIQSLRFSIVNSTSCISRKWLSSFIANARELGEGFRQVPLQVLDGQGVADAGHHVFALGVEQIIAVEFLVPVDRVAGEGHPGPAVVAQVAEDHRLNVDGGAQVVANTGGVAVIDGPLAEPTVENSPGGHFQLLEGVLGKFPAGDRT